MQSETASHRAIAAGISCGLGILLPAAACAVTLPFEGVHQAVSAAAVPFATGILAGVGALAASSYALEHADGASGQHRARDRRMGGAAAAEVDAQKDAVSQQPAAMKGVPVITRAAGAMSDAEAWAEFDALLAEDSPVSCDPTRSKDLYEIAFAEMAATAGATATDGAGAAQETAAAGAPAGAHAAAGPARTAGVAPGATGASGAEEFVPFVDLEEEAAAPAGAHAAPAADAAGEPAGQTSFIVIDAHTPAAQTNPLGAEQEPAGGSSPDTTGVYLRLVASYTAQKPNSEDAGAPAAEAEAAPAAGDAAAAAEEAARSRAASTVVAMLDQAVEEQDIWARALAIMEEPLPEPAAEEEAPRPEGAHFARPLDSAVTRSFVAQTGDEVMMRMHVDRLVEEEFTKLRAKSARRTSRDHFRVLDGGTTAVLPRVSAEA